MFKKLKPGESEEDVLRMAAEFNAERAKDPNFQPAAAFVRMDKGAARFLLLTKYLLNTFIVDFFHKCSS